MIYSFECDKKAIIGRNVKFLHRGFGTVISARAIIGNNVQIQHHVTLGTRHSGDRIIIEENVYIGAYATWKCENWARCCNRSRSGCFK